MRLNLAQVIAPSGGVSGGGTTNSPAQFEMPSVLNGQFRARIKGVAGQQYDVQVSSNLLNWSTLATVTNSTGAVQVADSVSSGWPRKFYRAITK